MMRFSFSRDSTGLGKKLKESEGGTSLPQKKTLSNEVFTSSEYLK